MVERVVVGPWKTNCYIYSSSKKECIIIDPGGDEAEIAARVDALNMVPVGIAITHGHVDHVAALGKLRESYARRGYKLPIGICSLDRKFLGMGAMETHRESLELLGLDELEFFGVDPGELPKADVRLKEGDRVFTMDLVVLETPGHTPGSLCFYGEKEGILFSGDTLFFDGVGRTDLPGGSVKKLRESIQKKIAVLPPETRVFAGHGPFTTVEREKRGNPFFREVPPTVPPPPARVPARSAPAASGAKPAARTPKRRARPLKGRTRPPKRRTRPLLKGRTRPGTAAGKSRVAKRKHGGVSKGSPRPASRAKKHLRPARPPAAHKGRKRTR